MKSFYYRFCSALATFALIINLNTSLKAQTTLLTGDLAFSGYKGADAALPDQFSFVLLKAITATTVIKFTDYGWRTNVGVQFTNSGIVESELTFTAGSAIPAGREITFVSGDAVATFTNGATAGTMVYSVGAGFLIGNLNLASNGDQIFAYQGTFPTPTTFIAGIHMNVYTGTPSTTTAAAWDGVLAAGSQDNNNSEKPAALTTYTNANWFNPEADNVRFVCGSTPVNTAPQALAALNSGNNLANWLTNNLGPSGFTLPTGCTYMGLVPLPVSIESFTGKLNSDKTVTLQWKLAAQQDIQEYIVEESSNGSDFSQLGIVASVNANAYTYSFIDRQVATGNNYYRLKTMDLSGKHSYSDVIVVNLKAGIKVNIFPNPVTDKLTIQQFGTIQNKTAVLSDGQGKILQHIKLTNLLQPVNMEKYPAGIYILKLEDGTVFKVLKQ